MNRHAIRIEVAEGDWADGPEAMVEAIAYALHGRGILLKSIQYLGLAPEPAAPIEVTGSDSGAVEGA